MLSKLKISHYKGFFDEQEIEFSVPDGSKNGSGLTVIVGPNNTGKTTIIEALLLSQNTGSKRFKESERHSRNDPNIVIEDKDGNSKSLTNTDKGSVIQETFVSGTSLNLEVELIPSRRYWQHQFSGESDLSSIVTQSIQAENIRSIGDFALGPVLKHILRNREKKRKFNKYLKLLIPHFTHWTIDTNDSGSDFVKYKSGGLYHQANLLGDGIISLFRIVAHLTNDNPSATFIIDEPELSLHPSAQKRLSEVISKLAKTKQIIVCTHSPYYVNWLDFLNGGRIVRLNKHLGKKCTVHSLDKTKDYSQFISNNVSEYQKPQLLDTVSKEILFSDKILFTEGQEDVGLIRSWLMRKNKNNVFDIFGYGVGGETNMKLFLEMSKDLGLGKVAAVYDNNSQFFTTDQSNYSVYQLKQLPTDDIRDKKDENGNIVTEGVFTSNGRLKSNFKNQFESIMRDCLRYFR